MSKRTFIIFGIAVVCLAVLVPWWAIADKGSKSSGPESVPAKLAAGQALFQANCGACHTLKKAGTFGKVGPNLDLLLQGGTPAASKQRVVNAVEHGLNGRMPAGILSGPAVAQVADFVAQEAGK
jgi:mono/diheme cytochrome c family protein